MASLLLIIFHTECEGKEGFWATAEEKTRACWHQVHEECSCQVGAFAYCAVTFISHSIPSELHETIRVWRSGVSIDYRCADSRFLMSPRGMAVSETRVNAGIRGWKLHLSESN